MIPKRILGPLFSVFLLVLLAALFLLAYYVSQVYRNAYFDQLAEDLEFSARALQEPLEPLLTKASYSEIDSLCKSLGQTIDGHIVIILPSGQVVGNSQKNPDRVANLVRHPKMKQILAGKTSEAVHFSQSLDDQRMHLALPVYRENELMAVIHISSAVTRLTQAQMRFYRVMILVGILIILFAAILSLLVFRNITRPLEEIKRTAERFARGELDLSLKVHSSKRMGSLAQAINQMADQLNARIRTIVNQRQELEALISSITEGVIAVDREARILNVNQAAIKIFGIEREDVRGKPLIEVIRNSHLQEIVTQSLRTQSNVERGFKIGGKSLRYLNAYCSPWRNAEGQVLGMVVVVADITRLSKLETLRKEFVANVSHELKTPITSIKGYIETLLDGAYEKKEDALRFLRIIAKQSARLQSIIEDLLILSRIEVEEGKGQFPLKKALVWPVLESAMETCQLEAEKKDIDLLLQGRHDLSAFLNTALLEQAVINLIDNAIKYSNKKSPVIITLNREGDDLVIAVQDQGIGIPQKHLPRLYERFYRVDKARSRKLGSTGLGLAIVKHITRIHQGTVAVKSNLEKGSTFSISLPLPKE